MIVRRALVISALTVLLVACGGGDSDDATATPTSPPAATVAATSPATDVPASTATADTSAATTAPAQSTAVEVPATETPAPPAAEATPDAVIAAFVAAGLEAESPRPLTREDYGMAPYVGDGVRFLIPSLGEDSGGRVIQVPDDAERASLVAYYVDLGKSSALFYSHVFEHGDIVVQINGDLADDIAAQYEAALHTVGGD